jgi:hypothetical protein
MKYKINYSGIFLDTKSSNLLKNWFKLKRKKDLLNNVAANVAVLKIFKRNIELHQISSMNIGSEVSLSVVGYYDKDDMQMVLCRATSGGKSVGNSFLKIVVSTNINSINLSNYKEDNFVECNGPDLFGIIGYIDSNKEVRLNLPD